jgi:hypothetical protein
MMGYFPNMTSWEIWASDNCFKCAHWPKDDDAPPCPVEMAHNLYGYDLCNEADHPGKVMLDMLIPPTKDGLGCQQCAMFRDRDGLSAKHLRDWDKYKEIMATRDIRSTPLPSRCGKQEGDQ